METIEQSYEFDWLLWKTCNWRIEWALNIAVMEEIAKELAQILHREKLHAWTLRTDAIVLDSSPPIYSYKCRQCGAKGRSGGKILYHSNGDPYWQTIVSDTADCVKKPE
jgi:hypothetical protein